MDPENTETTEVKTELESGTTIVTETGNGNVTETGNGNVTEPVKNIENPIEDKPVIPPFQPQAETSTNKVTAEALNVTCSNCSTSFDLRNGKVCPNCGTIRRGRMPKIAKVPDVDTTGETTPKVKFDRNPPGTEKRPVENTAPKKPKYDLNRMAQPLPDYAKSMAAMPVGAIHMALIKKRGYGLTKDEENTGEEAFGRLIDKYSTELFEYMPEIMCIAFIVKVVAMPQMSKEEYDAAVEKAKQDAKNGNVK